MVNALLSQNLEKYDSYWINAEGDIIFYPFFSHKFYKAHKGRISNKTIDGKINLPSLLLWQEEEVKNALSLEKRRKGGIYVLV